MALSPLIELNDGHRIPQIGLGTWPLNDREVADAVVNAVEAGYRHIDTAVKYGNEAGVGGGIRASGLSREEFFVTTKLDGEFQGGDRAVAGLEGSLKRLNMDYVDLLADPLAAAPARGVHLHLEDLRAASGSRQNPFDRGVEFQALPLGTAHVEH